MRKRFAPIAALAAAAVLTTAGTAAASTDAAPRQSPGTVVEVAASNPQFSTLVSLIKKAGLVKALSADGPFTVMAPTNAAFKKVPKATLDALGKDKKALQQVLTYHVVAGEVMAADVVKLNGKRVKTLEGARWTVQVKNGKVSILSNSGGTANVTKTDIEASNGVIHVIDNVLVPQSVVKKLQG